MASHFCGSVPHLLVPTPKGWKDNVPHLMAISSAKNPPSVREMIKTRQKWLHDISSEKP
jgi:hypothetical protein